MLIWSCCCSRTWLVFGGFGICRVPEDTWQGVACHRGARGQRERACEDGDRTARVFLILCPDMIFYLYRFFLFYIIFNIVKVGDKLSTFFFFISLIHIHIFLIILTKLNSYPKFYLELFTNWKEWYHLSRVSLANELSRYYCVSGCPYCPSLLETRSNCRFYPSGHTPVRIRASWAKARACVA